ncbi:MAG: hypothetical protein OEZ13_02050 [Spirochaetia bacterium]|nr:hypothetical protein [Spirochaetia bacterium]
MNTSLYSVQKKKSKDNYQETLIKKLESGSDDEKLKMINEAFEKKNKNLTEKIFNHLYKENSKNVINRILIQMEIILPQNHFNSLFSFLQKNKKRNFAEKIVKILAKIDSKKFRFILAKLFKKKDNRKLGLYFIKTVENPGSEEIEWFQQVFYRFQLGHEWFLASREHDRKIIDLIKPYLTEAKLLNTEEIHNIFWGVLLAENKKGNIKDLSDAFLDFDISGVPKHRLTQILNIIDKYQFDGADYEKLAKKNSSIINRWLISSYFTALEHRDSSRRDRLKKIFNQIISANETTSAVYLFSSNYDRMHSNEQNILKDRCKVEISCACFRVRLKTMPEKSFEFWDGMPEEMKAAAVKQNLTKIFLLPEFNNRRFIRWIFGNKDKSLRKIAYAYIPMEWIKNYSSLASAYIKTESDDFIKRLLKYRLASENILTELF